MKLFRLTCTMIASLSVSLSILFLHNLHDARLLLAYSARNGSSRYSVAAAMMLVVAYVRSCPGLLDAYIGLARRPSRLHDLAWLG